MSSENTYSGTEELWQIERGMPNYNNDIVSKLTSNILPTHKILEFGAGIGTLADLTQKSKSVAVDCLEIDPHLQAVLAKRGFNCYPTIESLKTQYDLIYSSNVLEHVKDDQIVLQKLYDALKRNGTLAIYVPAHMFLYSEFDVAVGHYRRYSINELNYKLKVAGYHIDKIIYVDSIGFIAWWLLKLRGYKKTNSYTEEKNNHRSFYFYDRYIYPISQFIDNIGFKYLCGKNILAIARKI